MANEIYRVVYYKTAKSRTPIKSENIFSTKERAIQYARTNVKELRMFSTYVYGMWECNGVFKAGANIFGMADGVVILDTTK